MQLCDYLGSVEYGAAQCLTLVGGCYGGVSNYCFPFDLWSGTLVSTDSYFYGQLSGGALRYGSGAQTYAFSVRCVLGFDVCIRVRAAYIGYGTAQCSTFIGGCPGAGYGTGGPADCCYPREVWSGRVEDGTCYYLTLLEGVFSSRSQPCSVADSVRCVLGFGLFLQGKVKFGTHEVCSSATQVRVLLTVLRGAIGFPEAVRAATVAAATLMSYGQPSK